METANDDSAAEPDQELPDGGAPPLVADGDDVTVGAEGGEVEFASGLRLAFPRGAVPAATTITATLVTDPASVNADSDDFVAAVRFSPDGLSFSEPIRVWVPVPDAFAGNDLAALLLDESPDDLRPTDSDASVASIDAATDEANSDELPDQLPVVGVRDGRAEIPVPHFSVLSLFIRAARLAAIKNLPVTNKTLGGITSADACQKATERTSVISRQIFLEWQRNNPTLVELPPYTEDDFLDEKPLDVLAFFNLAPEPFFTASAMADLMAASDLQAATDYPVVVGWGWRSLATQFVLKANQGKRDCTGNVASVGTSEHGAGNAFDIYGAFDSLRRACAQERECDDNGRNCKSKSDPTLTMRKLFPGGVGDSLLAKNWVWWGLSRSRETACSDPVHFEHLDPKTKKPLDPVVDLNLQHVESFQRLWNRNNPCAPITEPATTPVGEQTYAALARSPIAGFDDKISLVLPAEGKKGAGCQNNTSNKICCPRDASHAAPYCAASCGASDPDAGDDAGTDAGDDDASVDAGDAGNDAGSGEYTCDDYGKCDCAGCLYFGSDSRWHCTNGDTPRLCGSLESHSCLSCSSYGAGPDCVYSNDPKHRNELTVAVVRPEMGACIDHACSYDNYLSTTDCVTNPSTPNGHCDRTGCVPCSVYSANLGNYYETTYPFCFGNNLSGSVPGSCLTLTATYDGYTAGPRALGSFNNWCPWAAAAPGTPQPDPAQTSIRYVAPLCGTRRLTVTLDIPAGCTPVWPVSVYGIASSYARSEVAVPNTVTFNAPGTMTFELNFPYK